MSLDVVTLKSLTIKGRHGYYQKEREEGNTFEVDLIAEGDFRASVNTSDLELTFDYEQACEIVRFVIEGSPEKLIETLCISIGNKLFETFPNVKKLTVAVRKLNPPIEPAAAHAEIRMIWNR